MHVQSCTMWAIACAWIALTYYNITGSYDIVSGGIDKCTC